MSALIVNLFLSFTIPRVDIVRLSIPDSLYDVLSSHRKKDFWLQYGKVGVLELHFVHMAVRHTFSPQ